MVGYGRTNRECMQLNLSGMREKESRAGIYCMNFMPYRSVTGGYRKKSLFPHRICAYFIGKEK